MPYGDQGEIVIRGPNVMKGYWGKPEATEKAVRNGWLRSGDVGVMDDEGYFFITDRVKDMINAAGFNVYPNEVEQVIYQNPSVQEAAVYGVADPVRGETVHASIVLKEGKRPAKRDNRVLQVKYGRLQGPQKGSLYRPIAQKRYGQDFKESFTGRQIEQD